MKNHYVFYYEQKLTFHVLIKYILILFYDRYFDICHKRLVNVLIKIKITFLYECEFIFYILYKEGTYVLFSCV